MNYKLALWAAVGFLAVGCAQQQVSQGGTSDFEPLPIRDTVLNESILPGGNSKRSLGKPIPSSSWPGRSGGREFQQARTRTASRTEAVRSGCDIKNSRKNVVRAVLNPMLLCAKTGTLQRRGRRRTGRLEAYLTSCRMRLNSSVAARSNSSKMNISVDPIIAPASRMRSKPRK